MKLACEIEKENYNKGFDDGQDNMLYCVSEFIRGCVDNESLAQHDKDLYAVLDKLIQKTLGSRKGE